MPRNDPTYAYYTISLRKDSDLHKKLVKDALDSNTSQMTAIIKGNLERYYEINDIRKMIEEAHLSAAYRDMRTMVEGTQADIRWMVENYYFIREALENMQFQATYQQQPETVANVDASSNVDEALNVWGE